VRVGPFLIDNNTMALKTNLLGYWKLEEISGSLAEDDHSTNDGTNYNITSSSSGKINNCYSFNGSSSRVLLPAMACGGDKLSISVWVRLTVAQSGDIIAVGKYWSQFRIGIRWGLLSAGVATTNGEGDVANDTIDIGSASVFTHLVMVYDGATISGSTIRLYVNGSEVSYVSPSSLTGNLSQDSEPWEIGAHGNGSMFWQGLIDEVAIWNKALTVSEISEIYNSGNGLSYDSWDIPQGGISGVISGTASVLGDLGIVTQGGVSGNTLGVSSVSGSMLAKAYMSGYIAPSSQIVADHRAVDRYDLIPQYYVDEVKKMLVWVTGMSHSLGYQNGVNLLEVYDSTYQATTWLSDPPPAYSDQYLRLGRPWQSNVNAWLENLTDYESIIAGWASGGNPLKVLIYGWSYETTWNNPPGGGLDTVFDVHWAGDANGRWGLDAADEVLTSNAVCMDTYIAAINEYNSYFIANTVPTIAIFSTGPVDENGGTENGFQRELKHDHIRNYVRGDNSRILFDYADILVHNNSGERYRVYWNDGGTLRPHDQIHPDNTLDYDASWNIVDGNDADGDHIGEVGALRLAKALWWLLARVAGWNDSVEASVTGTLSEASSDMVLGQANGESVVSGALEAVGQLSGSLSGVTTIITAISGLGALSSVSSGVTSVMGTFGASAFLYGQSNGISGPLGILRATGQIYTSSTGVSFVSGTLSGLGLLQVAISPVVSVLGVLQGKGRLVGSIGGVATVAAYISSSGVFAGHIGGVASVSGYLSATANISASINAAANVAGALKGNIIAASSGVSTVTGRILATANLVATSTGVSTCSATPILETQVGKTDGITLVSGTLIAKGSLSSQIIIDPIVLANLMGLVNISGISGGVSINYALLNGLYNISGLASGNSITYAALVSRNGLFGSIHGINTSTAILGGHGRLHSAISQGALSWADLVGIGFLSGSSLCSNIVSGSIREYIPPEELYGSIYSGSIVSGSIWNAGSVLRVFKGNVSIDGVKVSIADD